ncbi:MAG: hypothetical protein HC900_00230 [Methylacidiphilales bacterium]|nr:hypothetical protein [Candidatus Methylacidiphilales bacterium]
MLAGCASSSAARNDGIDLPPPPPFMQPVTPPAIRTGEDPRVTAGRLGGALRSANDRLSESAGWYEDLRDDFKRGAR